MPDVFGRMVRDYHRDELAGQPVYERSDGEETTAQCAWYFAGPADWGPLERAAIEACRGRVLDIGCGPGRALRTLSGRGHDVLGIDASPGAMSVAREWTDQPAVVGDMARLPLVRGAAGSVLFLGTHVGAPGSVEGVRALLGECDRALAGDGRPATAEAGGSGPVTADADGRAEHGGGADLAGAPRIVADVYDPTAIEDDALLAYLEDRWLADGVATRRFRLRYDGAAGPWRTLLSWSPTALEGLVAPTAWSVASVERGEGTRYVFALERG